ncbi:MAG: hypothetical protein IPN71_09710 [Fibrobacteres bacterium]|nr:hypothetical protein [Fibrobacterota bacterium]
MVPGSDLHLHACRSLLGSQGTLAIGGFCHDHFPELDAILRSDEFALTHSGPGHDPAPCPTFWSPRAFAPGGWSRFPGPESAPARRHSQATFAKAWRQSPASGRTELGQGTPEKALTRIEERCATPDGIEITRNPGFWSLPEPRRMEKAASIDSRLS